MRWGIVGTGFSAKQENSGNSGLLERHANCRGFHLPVNFVEHPWLELCTRFTL